MKRYGTTSTGHPLLLIKWHLMKGGYSLLEVAANLLCRHGS